MVGVEALPDGTAVNPTTKHGQGEASALRKFMAAIAAEGAENAVREQKAIRGHNQFDLLSLDQNIEGGTGFTINDFAPKYPCTAVAAHERQYFLDADAVVMRPSNDPRPRRRSCVLDLRTGKTRFEVPCELDASGHTHKRSLHIAADEGPIGRPSMLYLFGDLGVRGTWCRDRAHKVTNAMKLSAVESGLYVVILETTVAWNLPSGPWEGDAVFASLVEAGSSYLNTSDHHDVLFQLLYPDIALETGRLDADFGSEAHQQKVWESLRSCSVLAIKSARVRLGRWPAWHDESTVKAQEWSAV